MGKNVSCRGKREMLPGLPALPSPFSTRLSKRTSNLHCQHCTFLWPTVKDRGYWGTECLIQRIAIIVVYLYTIALAISLSRAVVVVSRSQDETLKWKCDACEMSFDLMTAGSRKGWAGASKDFLRDFGFAARRWCILYCCGLLTYLRHCESSPSVSLVSTLFDWLLCFNYFLFNLSPLWRILGSLWTVHFSLHFRCCRKFLYQSSFTGDGMKW